MHAHVVPDNFPAGEGRSSSDRWPLMDHFEPGRAKVMINGQNFRTIHEGSWSAERRIADMEKFGLDAEAISPMPELLSYWMTPEDGLDISRHMNEFIAGLCERAPGRFYGLGMVPLQDPDLAAKELSAIKAMRLQGIEIGSNILGSSLGIPAYLPFFQEASRLGVAIFVHALHPTMAQRFTSPGLVNPIGFPTDTGISIATLIDGGIAEACPDLRIAFSHGGGTFPFMLPRYMHAWGRSWNEEPPPPTNGNAAGEGGSSLPRPPAEYARRFFYDTLLFDRRAIHYLMEIIGHKQLLVGSDYPFMQREMPVGKTLKSMGLEPDVLDDITWNNCFRFLGIEVPAAVG